MVETTGPRKNALEHEGAALGRLHARSNNRKALAYWLGFLKGILASNKVETAEYAPLAVEAQNFLSLLHDPDALELIEDLRIWKNEPNEIYEIVENIVAMRSRDFVVESEKDEINELYGFCAGIACDNRICLEEIESLLTKLESYPRVQGDRRVLNLKAAAQRSIADGRITAEESDDICTWITHLVGDSATDTGIATFGNVGVLEGALEDHNDIVFDQRMFVLTGKFTLGPRKAIHGMIADRGGDFKSSVCRNTNYLCVAAEASRDWRHSHEGLKIMKAIELRAEGRGPELVHEGILTRALSR
ncbi:superfamily I DNA and RNA helicases and helicasesubunits-like protein [Sinorhizobium fredii NGR234]|uniref:Superfamily I DNA and RNA helicases and helicasesubunits-like protein n=1 Tax=Sinorhizobium fredii (strain NBRC 101917 / NGR234) TaxID=394 RepID=C3MI28_SINFN|nr:helicase [Sinorhizobium fredii]ACP24376.1 superfamily I DNA and RNA helicases and helicasesubunits-like protein [Sinorhizobium fredii NGR234]